MQMEQSTVQRQLTSIQMTPLLLQSIQLLQMSSADLIDYVREESLKNPFLEVVDRPSPSGWRPGKSSSSLPADSASDVFARIGGTPETLEEELLGQLRIKGVEGELYRAAAFIAGSLDDKGYLTLTPEEIAGITGNPLALVSGALTEIQSLEPAGIAACGLKECLLLQISRDPRPDPWAYRVVDGHLEELAAGKFQRIAEALATEIGDIRSALAYIQTLDPRPGRAFVHSPCPAIIPDASVFKEQNDYRIAMNDSVLPVLFENAALKVRVRESGDAAAEHYVRESLRAARWLSYSLAQRKETLLKVMERIVEEQRHFLDYGLDYLKPMTLRRIADQLHLNESTISRAVRNKFLQTPRGLFELKYFFSNGLARLGHELVSAKSVKDQIRRLIEHEESPLSDQQIANLLHESGYSISRRTVMKYRESMHILSSRLRGKL